MAHHLDADHPVTLTGHSQPVKSVAFSPSGQLIASGSEDDTILLWNTESGSRIATLNGHSGTVRSLAFSPDGTTLASGTGSAVVKLWDVRSRVEITALNGHSQTIWSVAFSPDGRHLASGSGDHTAQLWDVKSRTNIRNFKARSGMVMCVAFSPDGTKIVSGYHDNTIRLWDVMSGATTATLKGHSGYIPSVTFSPSGERIISGSADKTIRFWDAATGTQIATIEGHEKEIWSVVFSPNGKYIASGSYDGTVKLWDAISRANILSLKAHSKEVNGIALSHDGTRLASASNDNTVRIWRLFSKEASDPQDATLTSNLAELTLDTSDTQQYTISPVSAVVPLNNDITGSVTLEGSKPIGYGGFGDLFLGLHTDRGKVALKKPRRLLDEALVRRFLREIDLWCSVSHPHILPCLGMCKIGDDAYVVSPFIENGDLLSCMIRGKEFNRSKLLFEVAEALTHLHHRGIVHGDVKAQNILVADDGSALLCDFGLAKAFDTMATSTEAKGAGSVRWMAPELFRDASRSMASDVYSLGITIAEVLSGRAPYPTITESLAVMLYVAYDDGRPAKEPLSSPEGKSYATLWKTAEKCWAKDAKARPHMAEVLGMLFPLTREMA